MLNWIQGHYKRIALALSLCILILWSVLGTGASLAWFSDESENVRNIFHFAEFEVDVSHRLEDGVTYESIEGVTNIFDEEALYEPGYVQVVYLKAENKGTVAFDFRLAVNVLSYSTSTNIFGTQFYLQDYLLFGLVCAETEAEMEEKVATRALAEQAAVHRLNSYEPTSMELAEGEEVYIALIVRMPEDVANEANYRGTIEPRVELGIIGSAFQIIDE